MKKTKWLFVVSAMALTSAAAIAPQFGARIAETRADGEIHVNTWNGLKDAVKNASNGDVFVLDADIKSGGGSSDRIKIDGKNITIDLAGHTVDRDRDDPSSDGHVFEIQGNSNVTIMSSSEGQATVTGGYAERGGAANIHDGSTATFNNIYFDDNEAKYDGGAFYVGGTLNLKNCAVHDGSAGDTGGAIYAHDEGIFNLEDCHFERNSSWGDGGAINAHIDGDSTITRCTFVNNSAVEEDGGAISMGAKGKTLYIYDSVFTGNETPEGDGGAIEVEDGTVVIAGSEFDGNSAERGGAIFADDTLQINLVSKATVFDGNWATEKGGAIYNNNESVSVTGASFTANYAQEDGGAIYVKDGDTVLANDRFEGNYTREGNGGAVCLNEGDTDIQGGNFTANNASGNGGAVYVDEDVDSIDIKDAIVAKNNLAAAGPNFYLGKKVVLNVNGALTGSNIGITKHGETGKFTNGFNAYNDGIAPSTYFFASDSGLMVGATEANEAEIIEGSPAPVVDPYILRPFVSDGQNVSADGQYLAGNNWLSGISGERFINEINVPGTHDSAMRSIGGEAGTGSWFGGAKYAITQKRYIPEQMEHGVRYFDIRMNNRAPKNGDGDLTDDGVHLWQCHGKTLGGTYWAEDENGKLLHAGMVLDYAREFLERNPSEFLVLGFSDETYYDEYVPTIWARLKTILSDYNAQYPGVFYLENDSIEAEYTSVPKLKDVRGKILLEVKSGKGIGGITSWGKLTDCTGQKTDKSAYWDEKVKDVNDFFKDSDHDLDLARDGGAWENQGRMFKIGLNCAPTWAKLPDETPIYHSDRVLEKLFWTEGGAFFNIQGKYVGWIKTDGATEKEWSKIWRSNFFQDASDYCEITVDPNLGDPNYKTEKYHVFKNTTIELPYFNYDYDEQANSHYFNGWRCGETVYFPGEPINVTENMTFTAVWSDEIMALDTPIQVVFHDCDNFDGIRPSAVTVTVNGTTPIELNAGNDWKCVHNSAVYGVTANWDGKGEGRGTDGENSYRYEISGSIAEGYVITLVHTNTSAKVNFGGETTLSGRIEWNDDGDYDKMRASTSQIQVGIAEVASDGSLNFIESTLATPEVDGGNANLWNYEIGDTTLTKYRDGQEIPYVLALKVNDSWTFLGNYNIAQEGNDFTIYHSPMKTILTVLVRWADGNELARPENVLIHVFGDEAEIATEVATGTGNAWFALYLVNLYTAADTYKPDADRTRISSYSITVTDLSGNPVEGYETPVITKTGSCFDVLMVKEGFDMTGVNAAIDLIDALGPVEYTPAYRAALDEARAAVDALDEAHLELVTNLGKLVDLEEEYQTKFGHLIAIDAEIVEKCGDVLSKDYSKMDAYIRDLTRKILDLPSEERNILWNLDEYNDTLLEIVKIGVVYQQIKDLGDVEVTSAYENSLANARSAYEALTASEKAVVDNYPLLPSAEATYFAEYYLSVTGPVCSAGGEGADHSAGLEAIQSDLASRWEHLNDDAKAILKAGTADDSIIEFVARYGHIVNRYGNAYAFPEGPTVPQGSRVLPGTIGENANALPAILFVSVLTLAAIAGIGYALVRRKRNC